MQILQNLLQRYMGGTTGDYLDDLDHDLDLDRDLPHSTVVCKPWGLRTEINATATKNVQTSTKREEGVVEQITQKLTHNNNTDTSRNVLFNVVCNGQKKRRGMILWYISGYFRIWPPTPGTLKLLKPTLCCIYIHIVCNVYQVCMYHTAYIIWVQICRQLCIENVHITKNTRSIHPCITPSLHRWVLSFEWIFDLTASSPPPWNIHLVIRT